MRSPSLLTCLSACAMLACRTSTQGSGAGQEPVVVPASAAPAAAPEPSEAEASGRPIDLELRVEAVTKKGHGFIEPNEPLRTGDRMALHVSVSEPAFVYVGHATSGKPGSLLYPTGAAERVAPGADFRFPPSGRWLELDRNVGYEDLFVYAARRELTKGETLALLREDSAREHSLRRLSQKKVRARRRQTQARDDSPEALTPGTRGLQVVEQGAKGEGDVAKAHFSVKHR